MRPRSASLAPHPTPPYPPLHSAGREQVLAHYFGHSGPVYRVRWSPFGAGAFLSCSADWTIKLWDAEKAAALFTFQARDVA